jgi:hypothetical protein
VKLYWRMTGDVGAAGMTVGPGVCGDPALAGVRGAVCLVLGEEAQPDAQLAAARTTRRDKTFISGLLRVWSLRRSLTIGKS